MLTQSEERTYRKARTEGVSARDALLQARYENKYRTFDWHGDTVRLSQGKGYVAVVRIVHDEDGDMSYLGEFTNRWEPGAIKHSDGGREYRYFVPAQPEDERYRDLLGCRIGRAEARRLAHEYVMRDYRRACDYGNGWSYVGVTVTIEREGVELAHQSLWGIESDSGRAYYEDVAREMIPDAMEEARKESARLSRALAS